MKELSTIILRSFARNLAVMALCTLAMVATAFALAESPFSMSYATLPDKKTAELEIAMEVSKAKISGGEKATGKILVRRNGNTRDLIFRLENSNPSLVRLRTSEIRIAPAESSASFEIFTAATPIKTEVTINAFLRPGDQLQARAVIEIVPATLKGVTLSQPTLNGTHGSKVTCRVELNANAPTGGIELYLDLTKSLRLNNPNPRVEAGNREVTFEIAYDKLFLGSDPIGSNSGARENSQLSLQTTTIGLVVSLEPQASSPGKWQAIPGIANKVTFDVIPLRVVSISVQPTSVTGGAEALAAFTLNFPAGQSETVRLDPENAASKAWARPLGSSCQASSLDPVYMPLTQGATNHSFKVCTAAVPVATTRTLNVDMRSGRFPVQITVQP